MLRVDFVEAKLLQLQCSCYHTGLRGVLQGCSRSEQDLSSLGVSHLQVSCHVFGSMTMFYQILLAVIVVLGCLRGQAEIDLGR